MGRKIPGRKHRGVRDPEKQQAERFHRLKDKINAPPINSDEQQIPKSVLRIRELIDKGKLLGKHKNVKRPKTSKKSQPIKIVTKIASNEKQLPKCEQHKGESDKSFLYRVNQICETVKREAAFEEKYGVEIKRNVNSGEVEKVVKRSKDPLDIMIKKSKLEQKTKKKKKKTQNENVSKLTKSQKRQLKLKEKKTKKKLLQGYDKISDKDIIKFGDVVHQPPSLTVPKKMKTSEGASRPGKKPLLLKSLVDPKNTINGEKVVKPKIDVLKKTANRVIDKKGKRKHLPHALRRQLDNQQQEIVRAYKLVKKNKR